MKNRILSALVFVALGAVACSAGPQDPQPEQVASAGEAVQSCSVGQQLTCTTYQTGSRLISSCICTWIDAYFDVTQKEGAPDPNADDADCFVDVKPQTYPPELAGNGCTKTATYYRNSTSSDPGIGGRFWFCPPQAPLPSSVTPPPPAGYYSVLHTLKGLDSRCLGLPPSGWSILSEFVYPDNVPGSTINKACSGICLLPN